ncbi:UbiX family flavin prenyltransferase [Candidatus Tisiphia endosymbiont of Empis tessellata]|uniref:UbiX family flavin prenyltransferase n=1 Tax=Candidatus Tisiphia endosymbiont of Empis tessellata TaxID=3066259 RepID=UPI00313AEA5D
MTSDNKKKLLVAISGASGAIYGIRLLEILRQINIESHLIISKSAHLTILHETNYSIEQVKDIADYCYNLSDIGARVSCGAFRTFGMLIAPCSMRTLASIAGSIENNLISRAAGVTLKERRKLVLMIRETPLHLGHLENMLKVTNYGGIIAPPVPAFYSLPKTLDDMINYSISRVLDIFDINTDLIKRWDGMPTKI